MLGIVVFLLEGCVTHTERIPHHRYLDPPEEEGVLDELRREFGWKKPPPWVKQEPFYKRAAQGIKNTVSGWFEQENQTPSPIRGEQMREFQREQQEAIRRLQEKETQQQNGLSGFNSENRQEDLLRE